jgi:CheY-like chemotaxis protein
MDVERQRKGAKRMAAIRILIVEDDPYVSELFAEVFAEEGCVPTVSTDGASAVERLASEPFDLLVMDLLIPRPHGLNVLARLRSTPGPNVAIPVIVCTGLLVADIDKNDPRILGADAVLGKPVEVGQLLDCAFSLLGRMCEVAG